MKLFVQREGHDLKQILFDSLDADEWYGFSEVMELYGLEGLLQIARACGTEMDGSDEDFVWDYYIEEFQENNPTIDVLAELEKAGQEDESIRKYHRCILQSREHNKQSALRKEKESWSSDVATLLLEGKRIQLIRRKVTITEEHHREIADLFLAEKSIDKKEKLLSFFMFYPYPYGCEILLKLAQSRSKLAWVARLALENIEDKRMRSYALEKLEKAKIPGDYVGMLESNYQDGDEVLLTNLAKRFHNKDSIETLMHSYVRIYEKFKTPLCVEPLSILYDKSNCGLHRESIVLIMIENGVLPERIKREIEFDSSEETRVLYEKHFKGDT